MTVVRKHASRGAQIASELIPSTQIAGDDERDTTLLRTMSEAATKYVAAFSWCAAVHNSYFGGGVGGVLAVYLFHIRPSRPEVDPWIWIVVGDVPPAYIPLSDCGSPADVFRSYMRGMTRWVDMARDGGVSVVHKDVPPVDLPATPEWAEKINQKLYALMLAVAPFFDCDAAPRRPQ